MGPAALAAEEKDKVTVVLDWFTNPNHAPLIVALERGFFAEAGLDVTIAEPETTRANVTMVLDGCADFGVSDQPQTQVEVANASPLVIIGTLIPVPLNVILVTADGPVKSIADLRGKRISYADSAKTERDLLVIALEAHGIPISEVTLVDVEFSMVEALLTGKVDALTDAYRNFEPIQVTLAGKMPLVVDPEASSIPPYSELVYIVNRDAIDPNRVRRFLTAAERGTIRRIRRVAVAPIADAAIPARPMGRGITHGGRKISPCFETALRASST